MSVAVIRADARSLPLPDGSVDLIVTSPPYFGLRSYTDGCPACAETARAGNRGYMERYCPGCGKIRNRNVCPECGLTTLRTEATKAANRKTDCPDCGGSGQRHYAGQIGSEATPAQYVAALLECTREWVRVLKPSGSMFINLGDKYSSGAGPHTGRKSDALMSTQHGHGGGPKWATTARQPAVDGFREKCLLGLPWRYALACMDDLGLILRRDIVWEKLNSLPESVTDRCRSSHEYLFRFVKQPRYYSAIDEIREPQATNGERHVGRSGYVGAPGYIARSFSERALNPLGKLPSSVWHIEDIWPIPSQPLTVPAALGTDHFAAFPMELPRRVIAGWSPPGICTACGEGRRPVHDGSEKVLHRPSGAARIGTRMVVRGPGNETRSNVGNVLTVHRITGYACACPQPDAPTRPAVVLDPFAGTGTTMLVADALGRIGIGVDRSADYCRLARWRTTDPGERARAMQVPKPPPVIDGQGSLFEGAS